jgi:hypothetical protein
MERRTHESPADTLKRLLKQSGEREDHRRDVEKPVTDKRLRSSADARPSKAEPKKASIQSIGPAPGSSKRGHRRPY